MTLLAEEREEIEQELAELRAELENVGHWEAKGLDRVEENRRRLRTVLEREIQRLEALLR